MGVSLLPKTCAYLQGCNAVLIKTSVLASADELP